MKPLSNSQRSKLPPFGKALADRLRLRNSPQVAVVCVGGDAWSAAKRWNMMTNSMALVLPADIEPGALQWPVAGCVCLVEWQQPAPDKLIIELVRMLLGSGAESVTVWPRWVDYSRPIVEYDTSRAPGDRWVQVRESIRTYHPPRQEVARAS